MYSDITIGVVVPAYNEERFIRDVIKSIPEYVDRIYVVDDASTDDTWNEIAVAAVALNGGSEPRYGQADGGADLGPSDAADLDGWDTAEVERGTAADIDFGEETPTLKQEWDIESIAKNGGRAHRALAARTATAARRGRVVSIRHHENMGAGGAIKTGYLAALVDTVDAVATIDGDGQMNPQELSVLIDPIVDGEAEYVKGNRLLFREYRRQMPTFRLVGNTMLTFLTKVASGYWQVMDPQNGFTVISRSALRKIDVDDLYEDYGYVNDVLIKLNVGETRVADVPTAARYSDEESHIHYPSYITGLSLLLLTGFLWRLKTKYLLLDFHPLVFFYVLGAIGTVIGSFGGGYTLWRLLAADATVLFAGLLSAFLFVSGVLFLLLAMVFDREANRSLVRPQQYERVTESSSFQFK